MRNLLSAILGISLGLGIGPPIARERLPPGATSCSGCHAPAGSTIATPEAPPPLATLTPETIETALADFRSGRRAGTIMPRLAKGFSAEEAEDIARALGQSKVEEEP